MPEIGNGLGYSKLEVPKDGLSESLQFWGAEAGKRKAAADLANERDKVRKDEAAAKELQRQRDELDKADLTYKPVFNNFKNQNEQTIALTSQFQTARTALMNEYSQTLSKGDIKGNNDVKNKMKILDLNFSKFNENNTQLKQNYEALSKLKINGEMSSLYDDVFSTLDYGVNGDLSKAQRQLNPDGTYSTILKKIDDKGNEVLQVVDESIFTSGVLNDVKKFDFDKTVDTLTGELGTFKNSGYWKNKKTGIGFDTTEEGWTEAAEEHLSKDLDNYLTDKNVMAWAGDTKGVKFLDIYKDPKKIAEYRTQLKEELKKASIAREKTANGSKLNTSEAELNEKIREAMAREAIARDKPKEKQDEVVSMAQRLSYDAERAMGGDVSGMVGVIITAPDKKSKKTSVSATDLGSEFVVKFSDGSTQRVPKTKQGIVNYIAQSDNLAGGRDKGLVETAIREKGVAYDRPETRGTVGAGFMEGLDAIEKSGTGNDEKAATLLKGSMPKGWTIKNANNGIWNNELELISPDGKESIIVDYKDDYSKKEAQNKLDQWEQQNEGGNVPEDAQQLRSKYNY